MSLAIPAADCRVVPRNEKLVTQIQERIAIATAATV